MVEYLVYVLIFLNVAILGWLIFLHLRITKLYKKAELLFDDKTDKNLAGLIEKYLKDVKAVEDHCFDLDKKIVRVGKISNRGFHKSGFIRYNPFGDVGGNQSFCLCLLDGANNGFVISSIHSREGTRVYSKTVVAGESDYNLSEEEKKAIEEALK